MLIECSPEQNAVMSRATSVLEAETLANSLSVRPSRQIPAARSLWPIDAIALAGSPRRRASTSLSGKMDVNS